MKKIITIAFIFFCTQSFAQLTKKNFKLYLDNIASSDSAALLTKDEFLHAKELTVNFPWLTIRSFWIFTGGDIVQTIQTQGNIITDSTKKELEERYLDRGGNTLIIEIDGYNKQGIKVDWPAINIVIKK